MLLGPQMISAFLLKFQEPSWSYLQLALFLLRPLMVGVRFAVDDDGTPVLCLSDSYRQFSVDKRSSLMFR
jgi:hypothetical protein